MEKVISNKTFRKCIEHYVSVLDKGYTEDLEKAENKDYAKTHYQKVYFTENEYVPYPSTLINELIFTFNHFDKLNSSTSILKTQKFISSIRTLSKENLNNAKFYFNGNHKISIDEHYMETINMGCFTLNQIIPIEEKTLELTDENLVAALALHVAGQQLLEKHNKKDSPEELIETEIVNLNCQHQFNRNEQVLALYFLLESLEVNIYAQADRTKLTALFHLIFGMPISDMKKLKNSSLYKSIGAAPQVVDTDKTLIKYLNRIKIFFAQANFNKAVQLIDKQINISKSELK